MPLENNAVLKIEWQVEHCIKNENLCTNRIKIQLVFICFCLFCLFVKEEELAWFSTIVVISVDPHVKYHLKNKEKVVFKEG